MNRRQQLESLTRRVQGLNVRRPGFTLALRGPPGIGKSHSAVRVGAALPQGVISVWAAATGPELARTWRVTAHLPGWVKSVLSQLENGQSVAAAELIRTFSAVLSANAPSLLILEDLHECGPERLEVWTRLARAVGTLRGVALLFTSRGNAPDGIESLWLEPLDDAELERLLAGETPVSLPAGVRRWLAERSGGNPLFALEFVRDLRRRGELWLDGETWRWRGPTFGPAQAALPRTLEALIERVLDALRPEGRRLLELCTLLDDGTLLGDGTLLSECTLLGHRAGKDCAAELEMPDLEALELEALELEALWCALSGLEPAAFQAAHRELEQAGIIRAGHWSHALFREIVRARLPSDTRRRDAAAAIGHFGKAQPLRAAGWVERAELCGAAAVACYERAAWASASPQASCEWRRLALPHLPRQERAGRALALLGELGSTHLGLEAGVLELALEAEPQHLELVSRRARLWVRQGQPERARPLLEALKRRDPAWQLEWLKLLFALGENASAFALWDGMPALRRAITARWASSMVGMLAYQERFGEGLALADHWLAQPELSNPEAARLHNARGVLYQTWGQTEQALEEYRRALALCGGAAASDTLRLAQANAAMIHQFREEFDQAETLFARAAGAMLEAGDVVGYASTQTVRAANRSDQGQFGDAEALLLEAHAILGPAESSFEALECEFFLARVYALWGQPLHAALSLRHAQRALEGARAQGGPYMLRRALESAAYCEARLGDPARALTLLEECGRDLSASDFSASASDGEPSAELHLSRALALERLGEPAEALRLLESVCAAHPDDEVLALDLDRMRGDRATAQARSQRFAARGHGLGVHLAQRFFPQVPSQAQQSHWQLDLLGPFRISHGGQPRPLRGEKRRLLLTLLLGARLSGHPELTGEALAGALYPGVGAREARTALRQLIYQVREALEPELILTTAQGYRLGAVVSDVEQFLEGGQTRLWRGPYLHHALGGLNTAHGASFQGGTVGEGLAEKLRRAGFAGLEATGPGPSREAAQEGLRVARLLLAMDPYDAAALELGLRACRHLGHYSAVHRLYRQAQRDWHEIGEPLPAHWSDFLTFRSQHQQLALPATADGAS